ncbi:MAG TPA: hypothetical protein VLD57_09870 [Blastocatellia bacterium]|nr:hypothetical protein [Blastocatellia bacterium]
MKRPRAITIIALSCAIFLCGGRLSHGDPRKHDIGSAGQPSITGSIGGSVTGNPSLLSDLVVTVNFGELTPINPNGIIKVIVPIAIRSTSEYRVDVSIAGTFDANLNSIQPSDIGFGIQNFRSLGARATACSANSTINNLFNNDPAAAVTIDPLTNRASFPSSLASIGSSTLLINGPVLSVFQNIGAWKRETDNGRAFDAVLAIKPQWFEPGTFTLTLTFRMTNGPNFPC